MWMASTCPCLLLTNFQLRAVQLVCSQRSFARAHNKVSLHQPSALWHLQNVFKKVNDFPCRGGIHHRDIQDADLSASLLLLHWHFSKMQHYTDKHGMIVLMLSDRPEHPFSSRSTASPSGHQTWDTPRD